MFAQQATSLISQLLAFSRKQVLQPKTLNLNETVAEMRTMPHRMIGEDIELVAIAQSDLELIHADPGQIQQIIMNLIVNARDAMPDRLARDNETAEMLVAILMFHMVRCGKLRYLGGDLFEATERLKSRYLCFPG